MPDFLEDFFHWYLASWRRIDRKGFGIALLIVSVPSLLAVFFMAEGAGGFIGPILDILFALKGIGNGSDAMGALETAQGAIASLSGSGAEPGGIAWMAVLNNVLLLALFPLCRMRLRDMGYTGRQELGWAIAFNVSVVNALIAAFVGEGVIPLSWLWTLLNFGGYIWLSSAKGKAGLAVSERMDYSKPQSDAPVERAPDPTRKDDNGYY